MSAISLTNPLVQSYIVYSAILALKLLSVSTMTSLVRMGRGVFANPEDAKSMKGKVKLDDPIVERTRRAHLNDLENIPAFWIIAALYVSTGPAVAWATLLFRIYTVSRIIHTLVYAVVPLPQPTRAIAYMIPYAIKWYMGLQVVLHYITALDYITMVVVSVVEPAVKSYIACSGILALKVLGMSLLTGRMRFKKKVFANVEDAKGKGSVVKLDDQDVERIRRAHLNDLENIPVFWLLGALYLTTGPSDEVATTLFRVYTAGRILHSIVYAVTPLPQPARAISFGVPYFITMYMGVQIVTHYITSL